MTAATVERTRIVPPDPRPRVAGRVGAALVALLPGLAAFAVGFYRLGVRELWNDEFITWHAATLSLRELRMLIGNIDLVHALYYVIMHGWMAVAGDSPAHLRLLSVAAVAATAVAVTVIGRRLFDLAVGVVAGLLFVLLPAVSRYAQEARSYALVTLAAAVATWLLLRALDRPSKPRWWLYAASLVVVGWLHFVALLALAGHLLYGPLVARGADERRWQWAGTAGIASLFVLPLLVFSSDQSGQVSWVKGDVTAVRRLLDELIGTWRVLAIIAALMLLGLVLVRASQRAAALMLLVWALLPPAVGYLTVTWLHPFMVRYFLFTLPAWCLLVALGACQAGRAFGRFRVGGLWVLGAAAVLPLIGFLGFPQQMQLRGSTLEGQPSYVAAVRYIADRTRPDDGIAFNDGFGGASDIARNATDYEFRGRPRPRDVFLAAPARKGGWLTARECVDPVVCAGRTSRIWLVETGHPGDSFAGLPVARAQLLRDKFTVVRTENFYRVRVLELRGKPSA